MSEKVKVKVETAKNHVSLPTIALRGLVVFPNNIIHFEVGRKQSIAAVEWAMENNSSIFLITQRDSEVSEPTMKDLYQYGVIASVKQILKVSDTLVKVLVEGVSRAKLVELIDNNKYLTSKVVKSRIPAPILNDNIEALIRRIKELFQEYNTLKPQMPKEIVYNILSNDDAVFLSYFVPLNLHLKYQDKQNILEQNSLSTRLEKILNILIHENNILTLEKEIQDKTNSQIDKSQRQYFLREQMGVLSEELGESEDTRTEASEYKKKISDLNLSEEITEKLIKEADRLAKMQSYSQESGVIRSYLDTCLELPWNVFTKDQINIKKSENILNRDHYGLEKVKERILEVLAMQKLSSSMKGQIICLVGPPGIGKTSIAKSIAECIGRKYARMSLGGVRDESEIRGHRRTYIGAMAGKIISTIITAKSSNPLILLDEIDKLSSDFRGDPSAALLEALDVEQNTTFRDHYLDIPYDLSDVLFITTANSLSTIPSALLDRMDVIQLGSYTREEKFNIAKKHLIPKQLKKAGMAKLIKFTPSSIYQIIDGYTFEAGVRTLERTIAEVLRKCAKSIVSGDTEQIKIEVSDIEKLLGPARKKPSFFNRTNEIGVANGLAWTSIGGEILPLEVSVIKEGKGTLILTGSLGDVMKESATLALTYAKIHAKEYNIDTDQFSKIDIHIHAPEGAVPKDGPSAGVALTTALISALSGYPVRSDVAMTGEISLHGCVLPIGGLKEKTMAAYREKIKTVLIPQDNMSDLYEVDEIVKKHISFIPLTSVKQALDINLIIDNKKIKIKKAFETPLKKDIEITIQ